MEFSRKKLKGFYLEPFAFETLSAGTVAVGPSSTYLVADLIGCTIRFEDGPGRYRVDGTNPTISVGIPTFHNDQLILNHIETEQFKMIRNRSTNIVALVTYYRRKRP